MSDKKALTQEQIIAAARNDYGDKFFVLGDAEKNGVRAFPIKDLDYDSYLEFMRCAKPILEAFSGGIRVGQDADGKMSVGFDPLGLDYNAVLTMAGRDLPNMVLLCCKQSDPKITLKDIKTLGRRPQNLVDIVIAQIKHNEMIKEFADFFPRLMTALQTLVPEVETAMAPVVETPTETSMTGETLFS